MTTVSAAPTPRSAPACTGLRDRVDALDGRLDIESEQGCGTTLTVELPLERY